MDDSDSFAMIKQIDEHGESSFNKHILAISTIFCLILIIRKKKYYSSKTGCRLLKVFKNIGEISTDSIFASLLLIFSTKAEDIEFSIVL